jgi:demethylspheroidene O-methyltransferase
MEMDEAREFANRPGLRRRWIAWRNRIIGSARFQTWAAGNWFTRRVARRRSAALFDLVAGFTYTQTLLASEEAGLLDLLFDGGADTARVAAHCGLAPDAAQRLLRAAAAIGIVEEVESGFWMLGEQGAALQGNAGARAMILHHKLLYSDLADPLALLRDNRRSSTRLSDFWTYVDRDRTGAAGPADAHSYSALMASSQALVASEVLATGVLRKHASLLDVGGGFGAFASRVGTLHPAIRIGIFDLPEVLERAPPSGVNATLHPGDFFIDSLPTGYDCISLVRILHDHDDAPALDLLRNIRRALAPGAQLLIAEPMAQAKGAEPMGGAYFGLYLWAMRSGRPRTAQEIRAMLKTAGFAHSRQVRTNLPVITSLIVAAN